MQRVGTALLSSAFALVAALGIMAPARSAAQNLPDATYARDSRQPIDEPYTEHIRKYTTAPELNSPLTDYLPASKTVPTPAKVLGDVSGAPDMLPYAEDVYRYFRMLADATPRVRVVTIGHTEEGREMIAVVVADESLLAHLKENDARLAQLADPRTLGLDDSKAEPLIAASTPVYYITGTIHSPETGAPSALMELAYRLAVDDAPYIRNIRSHVITLITPVVEVDGRDRMVDIYKWHRAHPGEIYPRLIYWGHYVAHDNNRDAMTMTLALTRNVLNTYIGWHAQVLHDLHESVPFLYDNTAGDAPFNAWVDPILTNEWEMLGWSNVQEMTRLGMPGVFTHGNFDTWSPGYLMFLAAMHNGISRLYETFGNGGADTEERVLTQDQYSRTWYRQNPPYPRVLWSQRDNNNYEQTALLTALNYFANNDKLFLRNYYLKAKRSIQKPQGSGPAAYILADDAASRDSQAMLLRILHDQHVEVHRTTAPVTVSLPVPVKRPSDTEPAPSATTPPPPPAPRTRTFPAGSYVVRMDQPYSRIADALLDRQYWAPDDPQKHPFDDTGWSFGDLFGVEAARTADPVILKAAMEPYDPAAAHTADAVSGSGSVFAIENHANPSLLSLRYQLKGDTLSVAEAPFSAAGHDYAAGTLLVRGLSADALGKALAPLHLSAAALAPAPSVAAHPVAAPRIAIMHTWLFTQTEGWWRQALDMLQIPYDYISTQTVAGEPDLKAKYDVILFAPVGETTPQRIVQGLPMWGNPLPWQKTTLTPNLGRIDSTPDMRPGLGEAGVEHLRAFVRNGGLLVTSQDTAQFAIDEGLAPGVFVAKPGDVRVVGSVLATALVPGIHSPILDGYSKPPAVYSEVGLAFDVSNLLTGDATLRKAAEEGRPTGRGGAEDPDTPQGQRYAMPPERPNAKKWQPFPLTVEQTRNNPYAIPADQRPQVLLRYADSKQLLLSGLLEHPEPLAEHAAVVAAHLGKGTVLLFANNPIYRGETIGTYALVFNAILQHDALAPPAPPPAGQP